MMADFLNDQTAIILSIPIVISNHVLFKYAFLHHTSAINKSAISSYVFSFVSTDYNACTWARRYLFLLILFVPHQ
jgi:hypothetical protein